jgi:hypothetical protein
MRGLAGGLTTEAPRTRSPDIFKVSFFAPPSASSVSLWFKYRKAVER